MRPSFLGEMLSLVLQSTVKAQAFRMKDSITPYVDDTRKQAILYYWYCSTCYSFYGTVDSRSAGAVPFATQERVEPWGLHTLRGNLPGGL